MSARNTARISVVALALLALGVGVTLGDASAAKQHRSAKPNRIQAGLYTGGGLNGFVQYVSLRVGSTRRKVTETVNLSARCRGHAGHVVDSLSIRHAILHGGEAKFSAPYLEDVPVGVPEIGGLRRKGTVNGRIDLDRDGGATGTVRSRFVLRDPRTGRVVRTCDSGVVRWRALRPPSRLGRVTPGKPEPLTGDPYVGATAQHEPLVVQVARGAKRIQRIGMSFRETCPSTLSRPLGLTAEDLVIGRQSKRRGRFEKSGSFQRSYLDPQRGQLAERYKWRLTGRFGPETVAGSWRVSGKVTDAAGTEVATCTTQRNRWRALR